MSDFVDNDETWDEGVGETAAGAVRVRRSATVTLDSSTRDVRGQGSTDRTLDFLLSPSEWRVILTLHSGKAPASPEAVNQAMQPPKLPRNSVEKLLERLHRRGFISPGPEGTWRPAGISLQELLRPQIEAFFRTYLVGMPQGFDVLRRVLDEWRPTA